MYDKRQNAFIHGAYRLTNFPTKGYNESFKSR